MTDLDEKVYEIICSVCGHEFGRPNSCEECLDDAQMNDLRSYELKVARGQIKGTTKESIYLEYKDGFSV